ncbi:MAG: hypothetical protein MUC89_21670 [Acetobacteraceae bacterium]|nr:hypothetical protein [Acetobacteraceae bacterium]
MAQQDIALHAAERLEVAVERLALALEAWRPPASADMVPRAEVEALAARLDETLAKLRAALEDGAN